MLSGARHATDSRLRSSQREKAQMELNRALELAAILAWQDLQRVVTPSIVRIEYECAPGASLDHLSVWLVKPGGYQDLVYEHWTKASWGYPAGARFANGHDSDPLAHALNFILQNQPQFTHASDCRKGRILVYPPAETEQAEAAAWWRGLPGASAHADASAKALVLRPVHSLPACTIESKMQPEEVRQS